MRTHSMNRRTFLTGLAQTLGGSMLAPELFGADPQSPTGYARANTDWLAKLRYGIGVHWTAATVPRHGAPQSFQKAVEAFNVKQFVEQLVYAGAEYLLFTSTHALQKLPGPNPVIDRISPGRTCDRDLIGELVRELRTKNLPLLVYYNHSCNSKDDPEWEQAVGYHRPQKDGFAQNLLEIISWMGERYGEGIRAWWFDSPYSLDVRGPNNSVTTDLAGFQFPWERFTAAAKRGHPSRLVTYNAGVNETFLYTTHQDYWAGEMVDLKHPPTGRFQSNGLQWFGWTPLEDRAWVHHQRDIEIPKPIYADDDLVAFLQRAKAHQAPMTFNVGIYQDGTMAEASVEQLHRLNRLLI